MRLTTSWLLPAIAATASAATDGSVYLLQRDHTPAANPPTLSPSQARLVLAQRLGVSKYHSLDDASASTLSHINDFGGHHQALFGDEVDNLSHVEHNVVVMIDGGSAEDVKVLSKASGREALLYLSDAPSAKTNVKLADDIAKQTEQQQKCPIEQSDLGVCWTRAPNAIHYYDISKSSKSVDVLAKALQSGELKHHVNHDYTNLILVLMQATANSKSTYGTYDMPDPSIKRRQFEAPISYTPPQEKTSRISVLASNSSKPITGVLPPCFASLEACNDRTNKCSGHGKCYKKRGNPSGGQACFACGCSATNQTFTHGAEGSERKGVKLIYWGGAACQKQDVSGPFWLLAIFTIVGVGLITWAIGLLYAVGEEKLPGVIGAGVSSNRAR